MNLEINNQKSLDEISKFKNDPLEVFKKILGKERIQQYELNHLPIETVYEYFCGLSENRTKGLHRNLMGFEFNAYILRLFKEMNAKDIRCEVPIETDLGPGAIDCIATFDVPQKFTRVLPSLKEEPFYIYGETAFENKAVKRMSKEISIQIKKARTLYPSTNIFVLANTRVKPGICHNMYNTGTYVLRADITKNDLANNLLNIRKQMEIYNLFSTEAYLKIMRWPYNNTISNHLENG